MALYSNTKLDSVQKAELLSLRESQKGVKVINNGETTIAYKVLGKTVIFSTSVAATEEKKFRRKVGEFFARCRLSAGENVVVSKRAFLLILEATSDL